jgi:hypothetical protein
MYECLVAVVHVLQITADSASRDDGQPVLSLIQEIIKRPP